MVKKSEAFDDLHAHAAVVVRTFPESSLVIAAVYGAVGQEAPVPFAVLVVYQFRLDELPAADGGVESFRVAEVLVEVDVPHYVFRLYPPVQFTVYLLFVEEVFVYHASIGI